MPRHCRKFRALALTLKGINFSRLAMTPLRCYSKTYVNQIDRVQVSEPARLRMGSVNDYFATPDPGSYSCHYNFMIKMF